MWGRLVKRPFFLYEDDESFLGRFTHSDWSEYEHWLLRNRLFTLMQVRAMYRRSLLFNNRPRISVIMPVYNPDPSEFGYAIQSLIWQTYSNWELCIADDFSDKRDYLSVLSGFRDRRIKLFSLPARSGIAGASQHALERATGDYVALMDQDDELYPDAFYAFVSTLQERDIDFFYSDRDMISPAGKRFQHFFRPDWSPEYLLSFNYVPHIEIYHRRLLLDIGGFRDGYEGSQDYDLVLRATEKTDKIYHCSQVLYSWRQSKMSIAGNHETKAYTFASGIRALTDAVVRRKLPVEKVVEQADLWRGHYRIIWDNNILAGEKVTFVMIAQGPDETRRLKVLLKETADFLQNVEFVSLSFNHGDFDLLLKDIGQDGYVFFCDTSITQVVSSGLLDMIGYLAIEGVDVVGCKFLNEHNRILNAGLSISDSGKLLFAYQGSPPDENGYGAVVSVPRNVSAVFPSFWGCKVSALHRRGGLQGGRSYFYAAMDFFRKVIKSGQRIVFVPYMCMKVDTGRLHYDSDMILFLEDWKQDGLSDRFYNHNLTDHYEDFGIRL